MDDWSVSNSVASITNLNTWVSGNGINHLVPTGVGSLLGTTVTNTAFPYANVIDQWSAVNRGCNASGFYRNTALGRLVLDGGDQSLFTFAGTGSDNAIYIDELDLEDFSTNWNGSALVGVEVAPNMHVYYAQATANGVS